MSYYNIKIMANIVWAALGSWVQELLVVFVCLGLTKLVLRDILQLDGLRALAHHSFLSLSREESMPVTSVILIILITF